MKNKIIIINNNNKKNIHTDPPIHVNTNSRGEGVVLKGGVYFHNAISEGKSSVFTELFFVSKSNVVNDKMTYCNFH